MMYSSGGRIAAVATIAVSLLHLVCPGCAVTCNMEGSGSDEIGDGLECSSLRTLVIVVPTVVGVSTIVIVTLIATVCTAYNCYLRRQIQKKIQLLAVPEHNVNLQRDNNDVDDSGKTKTLKNVRNELYSSMERDSDRTDIGIIRNGAIYDDEPVGLLQDECVEETTAVSSATRTKTRTYESLHFDLNKSNAMQYTVSDTSEPMD